MSSNYREITEQERELLRDHAQKFGAEYGGGTVTSEAYKTGTHADAIEFALDLPQEFAGGRAEVRAVDGVITVRMRAEQQPHKIEDIEAARVLNAARVQLDTIGSRSRPFYVRPTYMNPVKDLLSRALITLCGDEDRAQQVYERLLNGADVADALADARRQWITDEFDDTLTFGQDDRGGFVAADDVCRYEVWESSESGWTLRVSQLADNGDTVKRAALYALPCMFTAELVARAYSASPDLSLNREGMLGTARDRALAAIERHKCHGCARDAHSVGHVPNCPQATDSADYTGRVTEEVQA